MLLNYLYKNQESWRVICIQFVSKNLKIYNFTVNVYISHKNIPDFQEIMRIDGRVFSCKSNITISRSICEALGGPGDTVGVGGRGHHGLLRGHLRLLPLSPENGHGKWREGGDANKNQRYQNEKRRYKSSASENRRDSFWQHKYYEDHLGIIKRRKFLSEKTLRNSCWQQQKNVQKCGSKKLGGFCHTNLYAVEFLPPPSLIP